MSFWWKFGILIASYMIVGFAGWKAHTWYDGYSESKVQTKIIDDRVKEEKTSNAEAEKVQVKLSDDQEKAKEQTQKLEQTVAENPKAYDCVIDPTGVRILQQAVTSHTRAR